MYAYWLKSDPITRCEAAFTFIEGLMGVAVMALLSGDSTSACGAIICKSYTGQNSASCHFDQSLDTSGGGYRLVATGWTEM